MEVGFGGAFLTVGVLLVFIIVGVPLLIHYSSRKTTQHAPRRKTTQHATHTPLWRQVLSLPHTRLGWWAVGLAGVSVALLAFAVAAVISPFAFKALGIELEWILWGWFFSLVASGFVGWIALIRGQEHSWIVVVVAILGVLTLVASPILPFAIQGVLYDLHSPWYSP